MTVMQRVREVVIGILVILTGIMLMYKPESGFPVIVMILCAACLFTGTKTLIYYFTMARHMVGGSLVLYRGLIVLDLGLLALSLTKEPDAIVLLYLVGMNFFNGTVNIMQAVESKKLGSNWRIKLSYGITDCLISVICICFTNQHNVIAYIYSLGIIYSAILRIINALRKSAIIYIQ